MSPVRTLEDLDEGELRGRTVLVRVDFNVPLEEGGRVGDDTRIRATLPTIRHLRQAGARSLLVSHLGRPDGTPDPAFSLAPVAQALSALLDEPVPLLSESPGTPELQERVGGLPEGGVALLENIRFHPGETNGDPELSRALASLAGFFVGEAFGAAHRAHASVVGAAREVRAGGGRAVAGFLMERELHFLGEILKDPERPFVALLGGAKVSGKIDLIEEILERVDRMLVGGAMANTFLRALGLEMGRSLVEEDRVELAADLLERAGDKIVLPVDLVVAAEISPDATVRTVDRTEVGPDDRAGDIGPRTRQFFGRELREARTVTWNGPMGVFEAAPFARGTEELAMVLAEAADAGTVVVVGGGDSAAAAAAAGVTERMTHVSTGGGAALDVLSGNVLPGVEVLETKEGR